MSAAQQSGSVHVSAAFRSKLIESGVKNLQAYGYPAVNETNILTDSIYKEFFRSMLEGNKGHSTAIDQAIDGLLKEIGA